jgi:hypothetical protein
MKNGNRTLIPMFCRTLRTMAKLTVSNPRRPGQAMAMLIGASVLGCSTAPQPDYSKLGLVEVSGHVTLDGVPVPEAAVYFLEPDDRFCFGITDSNGYYTMMLNSDKSGVTPGEKRVEISTTRNPLGEASGESDDPDAPAQKNEKIPDCYTGKDSPIRIVIDGPNAALDFELTSDCSAYTGAS